MLNINTKKINHIWNENVELERYAVFKKCVYNRMYNQESIHCIECNMNQSYGEYIRKEMR